MSKTGKIVVVSRENAEKLRNLLRADNLLDPQRKITSKGDKVQIPITSEPELDLSTYSAKIEDDRNPVKRNVQIDPIERIVTSVTIEESLKRYLPKKWEKLGDILVLKLPKELDAHRKAVAQEYARVLKAKAVLADVKGVEGDWRLPQVKKVWGENTETIHLENGVRYKLDAAKVMFSSGNLPERIRMGTICEPDEVVVDLFAGIGYFTIPMAVHSRPKMIYACEVNPTAYHYLEENIRINRVENVTPLLGDCRTTAPEGIADRVIMGYLRGQQYLPKAFNVLKDQGVLHYHEASPDILADARPLSAVKALAEESGKDVRLLKLIRLKSYAPGVTHVVLDLQVITKN